MKLSHSKLSAILIATTLTTASAMQPQKALQYPIIEFDPQDNPHRLNFSTKAHGVTDEVLYQVAQSDPDLESLNLLCCDQVTDNGLAAIANRCPHLQSIELRGCTRVTSKGVHFLATKCHELREIKIACCQTVTDFTIQTIAESCPGLQHLDCSHCHHVTATGLEKIAQRCSSLIYLDISHNHHITNTDLIRCLAYNCPKLQILCATHCRNINWNGIRALQKARGFIPGVIGTVMCENTLLPRTFTD